ncbi:hypothetical protein K469DRAFT_749453 [Zopfia rhizophila CBS 207.26]|uniref:Uncharacterized protein n=1 Tax=Zopfia rhizophila CBS 207.26 TaxID=1314779 RepID=A0A6A6E8F2_9PEZI|nr:hypothetical protein K469DRAFT_749453 [Zopfia rhizophila CBS 207.26]
MHLSGVASRKKGPVFCVAGLSTSQPDGVLNVQLRATIHDNLSEGEKSELEVATIIVSSCYNDEQERIALVEFHGRVPKFLSYLTENPLEDWQIEVGNIDVSFHQNFSASLSCIHLNQRRQLPQSKEHLLRGSHNFYLFLGNSIFLPTADSLDQSIIAIISLDGHAYGSWRGKGNLGRMWLRDFPSKDLPCCRTTVYGYNSKLTSQGSDPIMDCGRELIERLRRSEILRKKPLFFIVHSFCVSYWLTKILEGKDDHPRDELLRQTRTKSGLLAFQLVNFKNLTRDRKADNETKRWKRTGKFITAVDADSALLQLPNHLEDNVPQGADHSMIVNFKSKNERGYNSVRDKLQQFERDALV